MKYAQLIIGLLAGTAIGGSVVASTGAQMPSSAAGTDADGIKKIVREVIAQEPKIIIESVQKYQMSQQKKQAESASDVLKNPELYSKVYNDTNAASHGSKDSKRLVAEFFDYNCGACKFMFKSIEELVKKDKTVRIVFHEYPIFGPVSEANSRIGLAVNRLYADQYYDFHRKMMTHEGRVDEKVALAYVKELGMNVDKIKEESQKPEINTILEATRALGDTLQIQGTPTLAVGNEIVPHAISFQDLESKLNGSDAPKPAPKAE